MMKSPLPHVGHRLRAALGLAAVTLASACTGSGGFDQHVRADPTEVNAPDTAAPAASAPTDSAPPFTDPVPPIADPAGKDEPWAIPELDALADECAGGDLPSCDALSADARSPEHQRFGATCANRIAVVAQSGCVALFDGRDKPSRSDPPERATDQAELIARCADGEAGACDALRDTAAASPTAAQFGLSCGDRFAVADPAGCAGLFGSDRVPVAQPMTPSATPNSDLDGMAQRCYESAGSCDELRTAAQAAALNEYENYARTCGGRNVAVDLGCAALGASAAPRPAADVDAATGWSATDFGACVDRDMAACDRLAAMPGIDPTLADYAARCGGWIAPGSSCTVTFDTIDPAAPGDPTGLARSDELDRLFGECVSAGDDPVAAAACDQLFDVAPAGSGYAAAAQRCGGRGGPPPCGRPVITEPPQPPATDPPSATETPLVTDPVVTESGTTASTTDPNSVVDSTLDTLAPSTTAPGPPPSTSGDTATSTTRPAYIVITVPVPATPTAAVPVPSGAVERTPDEIKWYAEATRQRLANAVVDVNASPQVVLGGDARVSVSVSLDRPYLPGDLIPTISPVVPGATIDGQTIAGDLLVFEFLIRPSVVGVEPVRISSLKLTLGDESFNVLLAIPGVDEVVVTEPPAPPTTTVPDKSIPERLTDAWALIASIVFGVTALLALLIKREELLALISKRRSAPKP